ncbi:MAG: RNA polymerase sigma factor [Acidobacteria bacterium]|nr:RNA polymerase sigma factor [Acidobacteriota bacterium]
MAFAQRLFEQHGGVVHTYFKRLTGDATAAEDLTQEVFLRVVRSGDAYEHRDRERAWVFRIARNVLIDLRRQALRTPAADSRLEPTTAPRQNTRATLREALGRLPSEEREAFLLREIAGLSYAEISAMTDSTVPSVRSRIYRARSALREMLTPPTLNVPGAVTRHEDDD